MLEAKAGPTFGNLLRLDDQEHAGRIPDIDHLVPLDAVAGKTAARRNIHYAGAVRIGDLHSRAGDRVAEMPVVIMALMPDARGERASENPVAPVVVQRLADGRTLPAGFEWIRKPRCRRTGREQGETGQKGAERDSSDRYQWLP